MSNFSLPRVLKYLRAANGNLTQEQVAERLHVSTSLIAKFETARLVPMPDTAARMDDIFGTGDLIQALAAEARKTAPAEWFRPWADHEREASAIRSYEGQVIPGLLQTEAYARTVFDNGLRTIEEVDRQVAVRLERQATVLNRDDPPVMTFMIDECALRYGDPTVMKEQVAHLAEVAHRPRVFVHVVPLSAGMHIGKSGSFALATVPGAGDVGYVEDQLEGRFSNDPGRVVYLGQVWQAVTAVALPRDQSQDLILRMVDDDD